MQISNPINLPENPPENRTNNSENPPKDPVKISDKFEISYGLCIIINQMDFYITKDSVY